MVDAAVSLPASSGAAIAASAGRGVAGGGWTAGSAALASTGVGSFGDGGPGATLRPAGGVVLRFSFDGNGGGSGADRAGDAARDSAADRDAEAAQEARPRPVQKLRTRLDPETLRIFTEVIDPVTREALYRVPPTAISETAEREGEFLARYERMASALALEPAPRPAASLEA
jgi:hypothetical protein